MIFLNGKFNSSKVYPKNKFKFSSMNSRELSELQVKRSWYYLLTVIFIVSVLLIGCEKKEDNSAKIDLKTKENKEITSKITTKSSTKTPTIEKTKEPTPTKIIQKGPIAGNQNGKYPIPDEGKAENVSEPDHVIGSGTPESCKAEDFIKAVEKGGKIVFNSGSKPTTITLNRPAKIYNANPDVVIDGGGLITLSGGNKNRIIYMNTCDSNLGWTTSHCQNQDRPRLTVQNITFENGNSISEKEYDGGGAIWVRGGRFKVVNCRFFNNVCGNTGPDVGGGAIRVFSQYNGLPVYVVNSTFGGAEGLGNSGSNGGAISSIGVSWTIINSVFSYNSAVGSGGNPKKSGTPGGGSGGAIYNDGNEMTLSIYGTLIEKNKVNTHGSSIFFVTNNHTGDIKIDNSTIINNIGGSWYPVFPSISMHSDTKNSVENSTIK
ncbi:MAG: hypothetical protein ABF289_04135 [Clostridiales bacterium]